MRPKTKKKKKKKGQLKYDMCCVNCQTRTTRRHDQHENSGKKKKIKTVGRSIDPPTPPHMRGLGSLNLPSDVIVTRFHPAARRVMQKLMPLVRVNQSQICACSCNHSLWHEESKFRPSRLSYQPTRGRALKWCLEGVPGCDSAEVVAAYICMLFYFMYKYVVQLSPPPGTVGSFQVFFFFFFSLSPAMCCLHFPLHDHPMLSKNKRTKGEGETDIC